jgi:hypothetical protein
MKMGGEGTKQGEENTKRSERRGRDIASSNQGVNTTCGSKNIPAGEKWNDIE